MVVLLKKIVNWILFIILLRSGINLWIIHIIFYKYKVNDIKKLELTNFLIMRNNMKNLISFFFHQALKISYFRYELKDQILEEGISFHRVHKMQIYDYQITDSKFNHAMFRIRFYSHTKALRILSSLLMLVVA